ncbi:MAG: hypothetical protein Q4G65_08035 [bacterium]|nr:hypothetical protein [bacterium]
MGERIQFSLTLISGQLGRSGAYQAQVTPNETKHAADMANDLAAAKRTTPADEIRELAYLEDYVLRELGRGNALAFGGLTLSPTILGSFETLDAPFEPARHELVVSGRVFGEVRAAARGLEPVNVNAPLKAVLYGVMDAATKESDLVTDGTCYLQGRGLAVDAERPDEGVWLLDDAGRSWRAKVNASDSQTVDCVFETPPPDGAYTLRLVTRGGGRADFAPVTLERRVTVRKVRPPPVQLESVLLTFSDGSTRVLTPEEAEQLRNRQQ